MQHAHVYAHVHAHVAHVHTQLVYMHMHMRMCKSMWRFWKVQPAGCSALSNLDPEPRYRAPGGHDSKRWHFSGAVLNNQPTTHVDFASMSSG